MKFSAPITAMLAIAAPAVSAYDSTVCSNKAPAVFHAISGYCTKLGYKNVIPNGVAQPGYKRCYKGHCPKLWMRSDCHPGQWVPKDICFDQFWNICAKGNKHGAGQRVYQGCQQWYIENT